MIPSWPLSLRYIFARLVDQQWIVIGRCKEFCFMGNAFWANCHKISGRKWNGKEVAQKLLSSVNMLHET
jgi:hypothetical protein